MKDFVHSVSIAEFDQLQGNMLSFKYPHFQLLASDEELANQCLPDGGHLHKEDWTCLIIQPEKTNDGGALYGLAFFRNVRDAAVRRGATQKAMLILAKHPYFNIFEPLLREGLSQYMAGTDAEAPKTLFDALNADSPSLQIKIWGQEFSLAIPRLRRDQFGGASLVSLLKRFREQTMVIWYSLLAEQRVLFAGRPAHDVCNACLAAPLLVAPLVGFTEICSPYISLADISPIEKKTYLCGTTNMLFESRQDWYDMIGLVSTGVVNNPKEKILLTSADKQFIKDVLAGLGNGEQWVRVQFSNFTFKFIKAAEDNSLSGLQKKLLSGFGYPFLNHLECC
eukprot:TRINITY_DN851_c0_g4_i2.p1 TRINITY_DN851_c0_g4~~TRINITY_DN851_c0_g4_i2.p1  ORF type:complete len:337 (-),score=41.77 TRINITY_DN851_c0_g4_i2:406-1416(-)